MKVLKYLCTALEEEAGMLSIMRIGFYTVILTSCGIGIYYSVRGDVTLTEVSLVTGMAGTAFGAKIWQKKYEMRLDV